MPLHEKAFWFISFFLVGVLLASVMGGLHTGPVIISGGTFLLALALFISNKKVLALLSLCIILGFGYVQWFNVHHQEVFTAPIGRPLTVTSLVIKVSLAGESQSVTAQLQGDFYGRIRLTLRPYPVVRYGDLLRVSGQLKSIEGPSKGYFLKEGIGGSMQFPTAVDIIARDQGSAIKAVLFSIRDYVQHSFEQTFSPEQATLMTGLVLGKSGGFSKEFTEKLKLTGTTHLVALSGYNISVVINSLLLIFGFMMNRRYAVWLCVLAVIGFVIMTGAEASVVRAAIMATIMVIAERSSRAYSTRNAIVITALAMILVNPNILVFDVGFQLSFLALLGIIYLQPAIEMFFRIPDNPSILQWRKNIVATTAAQLAVLPIILTSFGFFSPLAIITNVLLLSFIPYTMGLGFFVVCAGLLSPYLAFLVALPARLLLGYELAVINLFATIPFGFQIPQVPTVDSVVYYGLLIGFIVYTRRHDFHQQNTNRHS